MTAMRVLLHIVLLLVLAPGVLADTNRAELDKAEQAAQETLDRFMTTFNQRDPQAWAATLHYPHVRIASHKVVVTPNAEQFASEMNFDLFAATFGWDHSAWDKREVVQRSAQKVHIATRFSRYDASNKVLASYDSMYIVVLEKGRWGIKARSSMAP